MNTSNKKSITALHTISQFKFRNVASVLLVALLIFSFCSFKQDKKIKWVAIGDSITYLNDHPDETGNRSGEGYLTKVCNDLKFVEYINQGHNGWKATDIAKQIETLNLVEADVYTVFLGTNDWWHGIPVGTLDDYTNDKGIGTSSGAFRKIINKIRSLNKNAKIILITPMQRSDFVYINNSKNNAFGSYQKKNNQSLEEFAKAVVAIGTYEKFPVVDLYNEKKLDIVHLVKFKRLKDPKTGEYRNFKYPEFTKIPFNPDTDEYPYPATATGMTYDGLHPSGEGNAVIAGLVEKKFQELFKQR